MKNIALGALAGLGLILTAASPAVAADNTFELAAGPASAYGTYDRMMSFPERPVPPVRVQGTLAVNSRSRCGVVQIAGNGPADGIVWRTVASLCGPGKTNFSATAELLWGGAEPDVRVCAGSTVRRAERGGNCDVRTAAVTG
ncbi:hypothetical protein GCM10010168_63510 [Actinoplanes ianthinogenes]|uniref:Secreted protein n=1 Tax=Actinoplanes ianthinogenes TaxID=122358 RepID=A0ABM7LJI3_9ACTN|nr:hypothetical protein [Actinoplanes ianthinogenes]BCJ39401.1 hypothetical protein Aiant_00580 [Actinoplanes ianthinogenes]GGR36384.1 hypothetical protein GCM10010168_63510 [Actinoplanes ianthinogenes]